MLWKLEKKNLFQLEGAERDKASSEWGAWGWESTFYPEGLGYEVWMGKCGGRRS